MLGLESFSMSSFAPLQTPSVFCMVFWQLETTFIGPSPSEDSTIGKQCYNDGDSH